MIPGMSLNVHVMPLVLYLTARVESAVFSMDRKQHATSTSHQSAEARVKAIQESLTQALGVEVRWPDEGGVVFTESTEQRMLHALRSLAAWHEYPMEKEFALFEDPRDHLSLQKIYGGKQTRYPHLMRHSDNRGFWLPVDYPEPAVSSEAAWWRIGSSQSLGRELEGITPLIEALPAGADREFLEKAHAIFVRAVSTANKHELPVIIEAT
jgi:hypothetical protein